MRWTPEARARQAELIAGWRPWERSTGPRTVEGRARSSQNALRHGARSASGQAELDAVRALLRAARDALG